MKAMDWTPAAITTRSASMSPRIGEETVYAGRSRLESADVTAEQGTAGVPKVLRQTLDKSERVRAPAVIGDKYAAFERRCQGGFELRGSRWLRQCASPTPGLRRSSIPRASSSSPRCEW